MNNEFIREFSEPSISAKKNPIIATIEKRTEKSKFSVLFHTSYPERYLHGETYGN
ncbi:MAG: hypothetical protein J6U86_06715 [Clostridia bacterium]|nr:hypothetical protein [Clostridia bacterium]